MYNTNELTITTIEVNEGADGETIEQKVERLMHNKEPIQAISPIIYTDRKDGVLPQYNIRTDRFGLAVDAMTGVSKSNTARRDNALKVVKEEVKPNSGAEPIQGEA